MHPPITSRLCLLAVAALACAARVSADVEAPQIATAAIAPSSVATGAGPATITVTLRITDDDSGFNSCNLFLYNAAGDFVDSEYFTETDRASGDALDGTYSKTMTVPQYAGPGTWRVDILVTDIADNSRNYGPGNEPLPVPAAMTFTVTNAGTIDSAPPVLAATSAAPGTVSVATGPGTVTFTVECGDALTGVGYGFVYPKDPDGHFNYDLVTYFSDFNRISGDESNGTYEVDVIFPQGSPAGTWTYEIFLNDRVGNSSFSPGGVFEVESAPFPAAATGFLAQALDAVQYSWSSSGGGWVLDSTDNTDGEDAAMSLPLGDDGEAAFQTSVTGPGTLSFQWRVDSEEHADFLSVAIPSATIHEEISGYTDWDTVSLSIPPGEHLVVWSYAKDSSNSNGDDRGWVDEVRFQAASDQALPVLQALRVSPRSADLLGGPQMVTFTIEVTDDFNGLLEGRLELFDPGGSPRMSTTFDPSWTVSGDGFAGTYEVTLEISDQDPFGLWRAEVTLTEAVTNATRLYGPAGGSFPASAIEAFHAGDSSAEDTSAPLAPALEVTPGTVDVSAGPATATVTLQVTDFTAGFHYGDVAVYTNTGDQGDSFFFDDADRVSGDEFNGIYRVEITVPQYATPGTWRVGCYLRDHDGNERQYPGDLEFPATVNETFSVLNTGSIDISEPELIAMDVTPTLLDTSAAPAQIQVTVTLLDDLSGLKEAFIYFYNPADEWQASLFTVLNGTNRISGDALEGTYEVTKTLPQGSMAGEWRVGLFMRDNSGKSNFYGPDSTHYPQPDDGKFTVGGSAPPLFDAFMASHSLTGANALPGGDPDHDGYNNATELMLGTNPTTADGVGLILLIRDATHLRLQFTIDPALTASTSGSFLELSDGGGGAPLRVTGQTQAGLTGTWLDTLPALVSGSTYQISLPFASGPTAFARLLFETP